LPHGAPMAGGGGAGWAVSINLRSALAQKSAEFEKQRCIFSCIFQKEGS
jgi:hypothetical protein